MKTDVYTCPWCGKDFIAPKMPSNERVPVLCNDCENYLDNIKED